MKMKRRLPQMALTAIALIMSMSVLAQQRIISGRVSDANNQPLPGATVSVKGKTNSVVTNEKVLFGLMHLRVIYWYLALSGMKVPKQG